MKYKKSKCGLKAKKYYNMINLIAETKEICFKAKICNSSSPHLATTHLLKSMLPIINLVK